MSNTIQSGFNAMGQPVPGNRLQKGYLTVKEILSCDNEIAWGIANRVKHYIERDMCSYVIGHPSTGEALKRKVFEKGTDDPDELIAMVDLTGRYRILAEMLTD
jgi:hypothetical protein